MEGTVKYTLHFEEKDGVLAAPLPLEAWEALLQAPCCLPWSANGKRGLLYCSAFQFEEAEQKLHATLKDAPLIAHLVTKVMYLNEIDESGLFRIPRGAARFAQIHGHAVLTKLSADFLLLQADDPEPPDPKKGTLIRAEF